MIRAPPSKRVVSHAAAKNAAPSSSLDVARATKQFPAVKDMETRAARAVAAACDNSDDDNKIAARDAIRPLAEMLRSSDGEAEAAVLALWKLGTNVESKVLIATAGAIPPLVALLQNGTDVAKENAARVLCSLACTTTNKVIIAKAGAIPPIVAILQNGTDVAKEEAALALTSLAFDNTDNQVLIAKAGAITALVALLQNGNSVAKSFASLALKRLSIESKEDRRSDSELDSKNRLLPDRSCALSKSWTAPV